MEEVELRFGEGRISGAVAVFLSTASLIAVLCFHFPEILTTPELRQAYPVDWLRGLLRGGMLFAALFSGLSLFLGGSKRLVVLALVLVWLAQTLGGANVYVDDFEQPAISFGLDYLVLALLANSMVFIFIERVWPLRPEQLVLRSEWKLDLVYYAFNHVMVGVVLLVTTFFSEGLFGWAVHEDLQGLIRGQPVWVQFLEVLFVADFTQYWGHRLMHEFPPFWNFHAVHHCPARMDWLAGSRMHFAEVLFIRSLVVLPIFLLGFAEGAIRGYVIWVAVQAVLIHSNTSIPSGWLRHLIVTPHFHHWHHSAEPEAIDRNYAANLSFLDRLFGTFLDKPGRWPERYGVAGKPLPRGFLAQHLYPFSTRSSTRSSAEPGTRSGRL
jgi:sterol desaturase/sphingolipid hydroxylase (fatty acid hydroxylase superfamily)